MIKISNIYNLTNLTAANNYYETLQAVNNDLTGGMLGIFILVCFWIIIVASIRGEDISRRIVVASYLTAIISILFRITGLVNNWIVVALVLISALTAIIMYFNP